MFSGGASPVDCEGASDGDRLCVVEIARRLFGRGTADKLMEDFGGTTVFFPRDPASDHPLSRSVGHEAAKAIADECHGVPIQVPLGKYAHRSLRAETIRRLVREGKTLPEIARAAQTCVRNVSYHIARKGLRKKKPATAGTSKAKD